MGLFPVLPNHIIGWLVVKVHIMRRRVVFFTICLAVIAVLALTGTVCLAQTASVTVSVTVARAIHVTGNTPGRASVRVVALDGLNRVTFVAP
jgi:hypothetical protein